MAPVAAFGAGPVLTKSLPATVSLAVGGNLDLSVSVSTTRGVSYQWYRNGIAVSGSKGSRFQLSGVGALDSGTYSVKVSNASGAVESSSVVLISVANQAPVVAVQPQSHQIVSGSKVVLLAQGGPSSVIKSYDLGSWGFNVGVDVGDWNSGFGAVDFHYQWLKDGMPIAGATGPKLVLGSDATQSSSNYQCLIYSSDGAVLTNPATVQVSAATNPGYLSNLSLRAVTQPGDGTLILGFAVGGTPSAPPVKVLVRGDGPSLGLFGITGFVAHPLLSIFDGKGNMLIRNQGWALAENADAVAKAAASVGAYSISRDSADSAALLPFGIGPFSAQVVDADGNTGVALAEVYDANTDANGGSAQLHFVNFSGRNYTTQGVGALVAGFVIAGETSRTVLIRGAGPSLALFGVPGVLRKPRLSVYGSNGELAVNEGWAADPDIRDAASAVGAFSWGSSPTADAALLLTLKPGAYTAEVSGVAPEAGVALVEIYAVP